MGMPADTRTKGRIFTTTGKTFQRQTTEAEQSLVDVAREGFADDDNNCVFCGCILYNGAWGSSHAIMVADEPGGKRVTTALTCVACRGDEPGVCWKRGDVDEEDVMRFMEMMRSAYNERRSA